MSMSTNNNLFISSLNMLGFNDTTFGDMQHASKPGPLAGLYKRSGANFEGGPCADGAQLR